MKKHSLFPNLGVLLTLAISLLLVSCGTSTEMSSSKILKRKYTKGFHVNIKSPFEKKTDFSIDHAPETKATASEESTQTTFHAAANLGENREPVQPEPQSKQQKKERDSSQEKKTNSSIKSQKLKALLKELKLPGVIDIVLNTNEAEGVDPVYQPAPFTAILGFIFSIVGLFIGGIPLGIAAVILCAFALKKIRENPGMRGRGLAIAGIIIGVVAVLGALYVVSTM